MSINLDKQAPTESQIASIHHWVLHQKHNPELVGALNSIIQDNSIELPVRLHATHGLCQLDRHKAYQYVKDLIVHPHPEICKEAIASAYLLGDSRMLFPLVNIFNNLSAEKEEDALKRYDIIRTIGQSADPRAKQFLESMYQHSDENIAKLARTANASCSQNTNMLYTFNGDRQKLEHALNSQEPENVLAGKNDLEKCMSFMKDEPMGELKCSLYVVVPENTGKLFSGCRMILAPKRSEHVAAAKGLDVLAAGEIGVNPEKMAVEYMDNHSGGYCPDANTFKWASDALLKADIPFTMPAFSINWPDGSYFTKAFLSQQPYYKKQD